MRPGLGARLLLGWAVLATIGMVVAGAQALVWGIAEPVYRARCTTDRPAELLAQVAVDDGRASGLRSTDACTVASGQVPASVSVDRSSGTIEVTGMREAARPGVDRSLDGRVGVLLVGTSDGARVPGWLRVADALAPLSQLDDGAYDSGTGGALYRAQQPVQRGSAVDATFRVQGIDLDDARVLRVVWMTPGNADAAVTAHPRPSSS